ncbi:DUF456 domain-containing protein [Luteimonas sp. 8-5]|uniref:DUF456 domain-containing protein n=1 Tax=Luteimonas sp. 8-5 TaxID=3039387 RepID=UPI0024372F66|nr:DUF456 domain-containing protein [Luteimonas sp. 8-5]MDG6348321.1 DUF456 domain-containing protein [Luteimonas sp. 8-5]
MTILYIIAAILVLVGLAGIILPALPGIPLIFAGMLLAAWTDGFDKVGAGLLVALVVLTLLSVAVDFWAAAVGAKRVGASRLAIVGAVVGTFAGLFFGPLGLFVGPFAGAVVGELLHGRRLDAGGMGLATKVGFGTWLGIVFGIALKLMLAFAMLGLFAWGWWR